MLMEVLNHSLDLWVDVLPQLLCPCIYMGKPSDRPEIPAIVVDNLQVALPVLLHDPLVEELLELVVPSLEVLLPVELLVEVPEVLSPSHDGKRQELM